MKQKYKYVKSLVFNLHDFVVLSLQNNHLTYTIDLKGIINLPFYIIGVNYEVMIIDISNEPMYMINKLFNYNDPLIATQMQIMAESTNEIYGDNINYTLTEGDWMRYNMSFQPGRTYNLSSFPIVITQPKQNIVFDVFLDVTIVLIGLEFQCIPSFKLFIGTN
ncbi:hypothetical protein ES705_25042 [subsurface metagenome]